MSMVRRVERQMKAPLGTTASQLGEEPLLPLLKGLNVASDLIDVRKVVTGQA